MTEDQARTSIDTRLRAMLRDGTTPEDAAARVVRAAKRAAELRAAYERAEIRARFERIARQPGEVRRPDGTTIGHLRHAWPDRQPTALPIVVYR